MELPCRHPIQRYCCCCCCRLDHGRHNLASGQWSHGLSLHTSCVPSVLLMARLSSARAIEPGPMSTQESPLEHRRQRPRAQRMPDGYTRNQPQAATQRPRPPQTGPDVLSRVECVSELQSYNGYGCSRTTRKGTFLSFYPPFLYVSHMKGHGHVRLTQQES